MGELTRRVIGTLRRLKIHLVAGETLRGGAGELPGRMTGETIDRSVRPLQGEIRPRMVECRRLPPVERMTRGAIVRELALLVVGCHHGSKIGPMASVTIRRCAGKF